MGCGGSTAAAGAVLRSFSQAARKTGSGFARSVSGLASGGARLARLVTGQRVRRVYKVVEHDEMPTEVPQIPAPMPTDTAPDLGDLTLDQAEEAYRQKLADSEAEHGPEDIETVTIKGKLGWILLQLGKYDEAEPLLQQTLMQLELINNGSEESPAIAAAASTLGRLHELKKDMPKAEFMYRKALRIRQDVFGAEHLDTAAAMDNLAAVQAVNGHKAGESERLYRRTSTRMSLKMLSANPDALPEPPHLPETNMGYLMSNPKAAGQYKEALLLSKRALAIRRKVLGDNNLDTSASITRLARVHQSATNLNEAKELYREALAIVEQVKGADSLEAAAAAADYAACLEQLELDADAEPYYRQALTNRTAILGEDAEDTQTSTVALAHCLKLNGKYEDAETMYREFIAKAEEGSEGLITATALNNLAVMLEEDDQYEEAGDLIRRALAIRERLLGPRHPDTLQCKSHLADVLAGWRLALYDEAETLYREVLQERKSTLGSAHADTAASVYQLGSMLEALGRDEEAEQLYRELLAAQELTFGVDSLFLGTTLVELARILEKQDKVEEAAPLEEKGRRFMAILSFAKRTMDNTYGPTVVKRNGSL